VSLFAKRSVTVDEALELSSNGALLIDVRQRHELSSGMAKGAQHIPMASIEPKMSRLEGKQVLVICRSGSRSGRVAAMLRRRGIDALNVKGGMLAWSRKDLPTQRKSAQR
jgi:rhodanese-related sulfurtransferase